MGPAIKIHDKRPVRVGNSHYFLIPAALIKNEVIDRRQNYDISVKQVLKPL